MNYLDGETNTVELYTPSQDFFSDFDDEIPPPPDSPTESPEASPKISQRKKPVEEGEISTESEFEIEPEEVKRRAAEKRQRKRKQRNESSKRKTSPEKLQATVVQVLHRGKKVRTSKPPPFEAKFFHEVCPSRDYKIKRKSQGRVFFDGIVIPENCIGNVFPADYLRCHKVSTSVYPFYIKGKDKENGFWLEFFNNSPYDITLKEDRACAYLCLTKLESFFVQHEEIYSPEERKNFGIWDNSHHRSQIGRERRRKWRK